MYSVISEYVKTGRGGGVKVPGMTNAQYNAALETLARLIEAAAKDPAQAAAIVRAAKVDQ